MDESEWASGYRADLWFGPDANTLAYVVRLQVTLGTETIFAIRQAYVALRTPVGNGIDWKMGVMDGIIGYESTTDGANPNMTRSYGYTIEPTTQTGLLGTYRFTRRDLGNVWYRELRSDPQSTNALATSCPDQSWKAYTGSLALTAPSDWGWLAGSTLYSGFITGFDSAAYWCSEQLLHWRNRRHSRDGFEGRDGSRLRSYSRG